MLFLFNSVCFVYTKTKNYGERPSWIDVLIVTTDKLPFLLYPLPLFTFLGLGLWLVSLFVSLSLCVAFLNAWNTFLSSWWQFVLGLSLTLTYFFPSSFFLLFFTVIPILNTISYLVTILMFYIWWIQTYIKLKFICYNVGSMNICMHTNIIYK